MYKYMGFADDTSNATTLKGDLDLSVCSSVLPFENVYDKDGEVGASMSYGLVASLLKE